MNGISFIDSDDHERLRAVADEHSFDLVVLFGSRAKGRARADSDVDIGVWCEWPQLTSERQRYERERIIRRAISRALPSDCDLHFAFLNHAGSLLLRSIAETGVPLYRRDASTWPRFRVYANRRYRADGRFRRRLADSLRKKYHDHQRTGS